MKSAKERSNWKHLNIIPFCKIQIIDEKTNTWKTLSEIPDTPKHINNETKKLSKKYKNLWLKDIMGRKPLF